MNLYKKHYKINIRCINEIDELSPGEVGIVHLNSSLCKSLYIAYIQF